MDPDWETARPMTPPEPTREERAAAAYRRRMGAAVVVSLLLHVAAFVPEWRGDRHRVALEDEAFEPIVIDLQPEPVPQQEPPKRLIDAAVESPTPPDQTDLIAETDSAASDLSDAPPTGDAPRMEAGEFEQLGRTEPVPPPQPPAASAPAEEPVPEPDAPAEETPEPAEEPMVVAANPKRETVRPMEAPRANPQRQQPAPATPPVEPQPPQPSAPVEREARNQTPVEGEAVNAGFLGFEAMRHELAPYMKTVRNAVEKRWKIAIHLKYTGTDPVKSVIECAIAPDGRLVFVDIVEPGSNVTHAVLCKKAIEEAGPFPPFPFEVPEMYRNENLRIRWTFSFL